MSERVTHYIRVWVSSVQAWYVVPYAGSSTSHEAIVEDVLDADWEWVQGRHEHTGTLRVIRWSDITLLEVTKA